jgi:uncharacterized protein (TIGR02996 family)
MSLTTDEEGLLAAITAAPADDAPRLVYADWLQERGEETKAEYLRTVVRLMHPPEELADVARVVDLAKGLDEEWRTRVAGRFELLGEGSAAFELLAYVLATVLKMALRDRVTFWSPDKPVALRNGMTREGAEELVAPWRETLLVHDDSKEPFLRVTIRPMTEESGPTLFAPRGETG